MTTRFRTSPPLRRALAILAVGVIALASAPALADITNTIDGSAASLGAALTSGSSGLTFTGFTSYGRTSGGAGSMGTYVSTGDLMGLGGTSGIVLSSGSVGSYSSGPNTSDSFSTSYGGPSVGPHPSWEASMRALDGGFPSFDDTYFEILFTTLAGIDTINFDFVFASEEFPEFVGTQFTDVFGAFLVLDTGGTPVLSDTDNVSFDGNGNSININADFLPRTLDTGTEADEALPRLVTTASVTELTDYRLIFGINDESDMIYDSTVWITGLSGGTGGDPGTEQIPAPGAAMLGLIGLGAIASKRRRRG